MTGDTVEFTGGSLAADEEDHFEITLTAPAEAGEIRFPAIQTCEQGELAWIEVAEEGAAEPEHPAPTLKITDGPPTAEELAAEHGEGEGATHEEETSATLVAIASNDDDESSNTGTVVVVVVVAAVALVGGGVVLARRKSPAPTS